jgi:hypothetical protein
MWPKLKELIKFNGLIKVLMGLINLNKDLFEGQFKVEIQLGQNRKK